MPKAEPRRPDREPSQVEMLARAAVGLPRQPLRALAGVPTTLAHLDDLPGVGALPGISTFSRVAARARNAMPGLPDGDVLDTVAVRAPYTRFQEKISPHRRFAYASLSLERMREVKSALGVSINDVVLAICAGALREWLDERSELPDEPLVAMVPLSVRTEEQRGDFGNRVSMMFVPIPTHSAEPRGRVEQAHATMAIAKERFKAMPAEILQDVTRFMPPALAARAARVTAQVGGVGRLRPLNLVISNVPGPRNPLFFAGAKLERYFPVSVITDGVGLNITCISYRDHVDFGIVADRDQMDDVWPLMDGIGRALDELHAEVVGTAPDDAGEPAPAPAAATPVPA